MTPLDLAAIAALARAYSTHTEITLLYHEAGYLEAPPNFPEASNIFRQIWRAASNGALVKPAVLVQRALVAHPHNEPLRQWLAAHDRTDVGAPSPPQGPVQENPNADPATPTPVPPADPIAPPVAPTPVPPADPIAPPAPPPVQPADPIADRPHAPTLKSIIKTLQFAYTGVWGAKVFWLALLTLVPLFLGVKGIIPLNISPATVVYLVYHSVGIYNWMSVQPIEQEARHFPRDERVRAWCEHASACRTIHRRHVRYVLPLSLAVAVLLVATAIAQANWQWGSEHTKLKLPTWVYGIVGTPQPRPPIKAQVRKALLAQARAEAPPDFDLDHQHARAFIDRCYVVGAPIAEGSNGPFYRTLIDQQAVDAPADCRKHSVSQLMDLARVGPLLILGDPSVRKLPPLRALRAALASRQTPAVLIVIRECLGYAATTYIEDCVVENINRALVAAGHTKLSKEAAFSVFSEDKGLWLLVDSIDDPANINTVESITRQLLTISQRFERRIVVSGRPELIEWFLYERIHVDEVRRFAARLQPVLVTGLSRAGYTQLGVNQPDLQARLALFEAISRCPPNGDNSRLARSIMKMTSVLTSSGDFPGVPTDELCSDTTRDKLVTWALSARFDSACFGAVCDQEGTNKSSLRDAWSRVIQRVSETPSAQHDYSLADVSNMAWPSGAVGPGVERLLLSVLTSTGVLTVTARGRVSANPLWIPRPSPAVRDTPPPPTRAATPAPSAAKDQQACDALATLIVRDAAFDADAYVTARRGDAQRITNCKPSLNDPVLLARIARIRTILNKGP